MREKLIIAMQHNQIIDIMYIAKDDAITKRRIKLIKISGNTVQAYCFTLHAKRTFTIDNVLAVYPVISKASGLNA
ncbi:transcriptional regulator [Solibacillus merdavium]|uniref:Transcriptional regulator n=1 Tax=Solibacillus merdavium TaxID=2762218 RepID=A0ABR8XM61_9BACL|nr:transcriptional regulator [Solibacillus merdavium]MBD8033027.1 transcriptional regulator [Solibacillus merdavium]